MTMAQRKTRRKNPAAVALAKRRSLKLTPEVRQQIARKAALARWSRRKPTK